MAFSHSHVWTLVYTCIALFGTFWGKVVACWRTCRATSVVHFPARTLLSLLWHNRITITQATWLERFASNQLAMALLLSYLGGAKVYIAMGMTETFQSSLFQGMGVLCLGSMQSRMKVKRKNKHLKITLLNVGCHAWSAIGNLDIYLNGTKHDTAIINWSMSPLCVYLRGWYCPSAGMEISAKMSTAVADRWLMLTVLSLLR